VPLSDQQLVLRHDIFHRLGIDDGLKTIVALPTAPKMTILLLTPILGPFGSNQLVAALSAVHPEGRTTFGYRRRHGNLPVSLPPDKPTVIMTVELAASHFSPGSTALIAVLR
jgi:hypothetical protein